MIILSAGHDTKFFGCSNVHYGIQEHALALQICDAVMLRYRDDPRVGFVEADHMAPSFEKNLMSLYSKVKTINHIHDAKRVDLAIELHFNASSARTGHGAECLYMDGSQRGKHYADIFLPILEAFDHKMDGRPNQHYSTLIFLNETKCPAVIIEPLFLDNDKDAEIILKQTGRRMLVDAVCECLDLALKEV